LYVSSISNYSEEARFEDGPSVISTGIVLCHFALVFNVDFMVYKLRDLSFFKDFVSILENFDNQ
jgi:hypothetical protein